jgi:hypothetical protein
MIPKWREVMSNRTYSVGFHIDIMGLSLFFSVTARQEPVRWLTQLHVLRHCQKIT